VSSTQVTSGMSAGHICGSMCLDASDPAVAHDSSGGGAHSGYSSSKPKAGAPAVSSSGSRGSGFGGAGRMPKALVCYLCGGQFFAKRCGSWFSCLQLYRTAACSFLGGGVRQSLATEGTVHPASEFEVGWAGWTPKALMFVHHVHLGVCAHRSVCYHCETPSRTAQWLVAGLPSYVLHLLRVVCSLPIHVPQCQAKWQQQQLLLPPAQRLPLPQPPAALDAMLGGASPLPAAGKDLQVIWCM
jgi:hypothetical protein